MKTSRPVQGEVDRAEAGIGGRVDDYDYDLPANRIAQYPAERRDAARLLILEDGGGLTHAHVPDLVERIQPGDVVVVNESAVFPARLLGRKPTGAEAEVLLVRPWVGEGGGREGAVAAGASGGRRAVEDVRVWEALVRP
ncbi:MAG: S-adenosylmethionine:tRNA ribosyltransferase-isomerase, partial [Longimicrobiales bacterium]|nr:S-adenosylmethionine:tRNA ribosyltransferase-isomerase [Longimicrobiales bacterium]